MLLLAGLDEEATRAAAGLQRTQVANISDAEDLHRILDEAPAAWDAILLGTRLPDPLAAVRRIKARAPDVPILILAPADHCARIQHQLLVTPLVGEPPRCVPLGADAPAAIEAHLTQAKLRKRHRAALHRLNRTVAEPPTTVRVRLPPTVERFFDAVPVGILLADAQGRVVHRNLLARRLAPAEGASSTVEGALPEADATAIRRLLSQARARPKERIRVRAPDGSHRQFDATSSPMDLGGGPPLVLITLDDVTLLVQAEQRVEQARAAVAEVDKLASMGSLVGGLAHEIRTPLTAVMNHAMMVQMLADKARDGKDAPGALARLEEHTQGIADGIDRVHRLIKDLNRFIRAEQPEREPTPLSDCVAEAARLFEAAHRAEIVLETRLESRARILADAAQVQQIALNLLQNALEASRSGARIVLETRDVDDRAELVVIDEGDGIPPEVEGRMFDAFVTGKPDGTGLGLSIVRRLAELHDARIRYDTRQGEGTTFVIAFPRST